MFLSTLSGMVPSELDLRQQWKGQLVRWAKRSDPINYLLPISPISLSTGKEFASLDSTTLIYNSSNLAFEFWTQPPILRLSTISRQHFQFGLISVNLKKQTQPHSSNSRLCSQRPAYQGKISNLTLLLALAKFAFRTWPFCKARCTINVVDHQDESTA